MVGGLHGNEPAGVLAGRRVVEALSRRGPSALRGTLAVIAGNLPALRAATRFCDRDLNRRWQPDRVRTLAARDPLERCREDREQLDLVALFEALIAQEAARRPVILLDLHTTSGQAPPFVVVVDEAESARLARATAMPVILDLHRHVDGPILTWFAAAGHLALGVEGGVHEDPEAARHLEAAIWLVLHAAGGVDGSVLPPELLHRVGRGPHRLPPLSRVIHRHGVVPASGFRMEPGFRSFDAVRVGTLLALDRTGPIRASADGMVFLPLYQDQGSDGFFVIRAERPPPP